MMHNQIIPEFKENPTQTLAEKLREQYKETLDLIIHHEWMVDLLNANLNLEQFESFITQEAYLYNQLAKHVLKYAINNSDQDYDELMKVGIFLYSESSENLRPIDDEYPLSCSTRNYSEKLESIWNGDSYPHKILSIFVQLWIREGIYQVLASEEIYFHDYKVWTERIANNSPQELVSSLSRIINQSFTKDYGDNEEAHLYQEGFKELEHLLSHLIQFELAVRNQAYHISFDQFQQSKQT